MVAMVLMITCVLRTLSDDEMAFEICKYQDSILHTLDDCSESIKMIILHS